MIKHRKRALLRSAEVVNCLNILTKGNVESKASQLRDHQTYQNTLKISSSEQDGAQKGNYISRILPKIVQTEIPLHHICLLEMLVVFLPGTAKAARKGGCKGLDSTGCICTNQRICRRRSVVFSVQVWKGIVGHLDEILQCLLFI